VTLNALTRWAPPAVRRAAGRVRSRNARAAVLGELQRLARSGRPVIAGPWLGEVGFEILYWIPFLRWAESAVGLAPSRIVALSRGGVSSWYAGLAGQYVDALDLASVAEFRAGNEARRREVGEQKQVRESSFDTDIVCRARVAGRLEGADQLHPRLMYRLMQPYWWKHAPIEWAEQHATFARMFAPDVPAALGLAPRAYVAVKFYFNDCFPAAPDTRAFVSETFRTLSAMMPVVSLSTGLALDDHESLADDVGGRVRTLGAPAGARDNLGVQTALVANARAFVGTYGGFSYLAPLCGVPALGIYADPGGFDRSHLDLARRAFAAIGSPGLETADLAGAAAGGVRAFVEGALSR
jgi:hypothetical protein